MEKRKTDGTNSLLSKKVTIEGEIQGDEDLHVDGQFKGVIKLTGNIFVGQSGVVKADVEADNVVIQGKISGNVIARKQLEIQSSGQLLGDCTAQSIDIKEGAVFDGRLNMLQSTAKASGSGASSSASATPGEKSYPK
jgi:cytoskeletal protein CcmA (bactofilin family)